MRADKWWFLVLFVIATSGATFADPGSYAVFAEFAREDNKRMEPGLNRRVFNVVEARSGDEIRLDRDGTITLQPGTYRLTGFSLVTLQTGFGPPKVRPDTNYPGYCVVYPVAYEKPPATMQKAFCIGSPGTAADTTPSLFDTICTVTEPTALAVGHQSGQDLHDEVYLSVYDPGGIPSEYHVFARITILKL